MALFNGDNGIKILEGFNIFTANARFPIDPNDADGFIIVETSTNNEIHQLFKVETTFSKELISIIDKSKLAILIANEVLKRARLAYFGSIHIKIKAVGLPSGYDYSFDRYDFKDGKVEVSNVIYNPNAR